MALAVLGLLGCGWERPAAPVPLDASQTGSSASPNPLAPVFIDADFLSIYQTLLLHGLSPAEKAERWSRFYRQRFIHWTGQLTFIKPNALLFRHLGTSSIDDVYLRIASSPDKTLPALKVGHFYTYIGRLERYDDDFRTIYLEQGMVFDAGTEGVPGTLAEPPPMTRSLPPPPRELPMPKDRSKPGHRAE